MTWGDTYELPLTVYITGLGVSLFLIVLTIICCGYLFRLRRYGTREYYEYNEVVLKRVGKKTSSLLGQICAICLEDFCMRDELALCPCSHTFHAMCLLTWLQIRSVCPMCNKPVYKVPLSGSQDIIDFQAPQDL